MPSREESGSNLRVSEGGEHDDPIDGLIGKVMRRVPAITTAVEKIPEAYRVAAFQELLRAVTESASFTGPRIVDDVQGYVPSVVRESPDGVGNGARSLQSVAQELELDATSLSRTVQLGEGGSVQLLARVPGRSVRDRQIKIAQIMCYVREKVFNQFKTDLETIRNACVAQGAYDSPNFVANFRKDGTLREASVPGSKERLYMLSPKGIAEAEATLRELLNGS